MRRLLLRVHSDNEDYDADCSAVAVSINPKYLELLKERWQRINRISRKDKVAHVAWDDGNASYIEDPSVDGTLEHAYGARIAGAVFDGDPTQEPAALARPDFKYVPMDTCGVYLTDEHVWWAGYPKYASLVLESEWVMIEGLFQLYKTEREPWEGKHAAEDTA